MYQIQYVTRMYEFDVKNDLGLKPSLFEKSRKDFGYTLKVENVNPRVYKWPQQ